VQLYLKPLLESFLSNARPMYARIDYAFVRPCDYTLRFPAVRDSTKEDQVEVIVAWWMAFA
jgi:hypothetical protein